jgi:hypothetical protein
MLSCPAGFYLSALTFIEDGNKDHVFAPTASGGGMTPSVSSSSIASDARGGPSGLSGLTTTSTATTTSAIFSSTSPSRTTSRDVAPCTSSWSTGCKRSSRAGICMSGVSCSSQGRGRRRECEWIGRIRAGLNELTSVFARLTEILRPEMIPRHHHSWIVLRFHLGPPLLTCLI